MNKLFFVISAIVIGLLLIGLNYKTIPDYTTYTVPMKNAVFDERGEHMIIYNMIKIQI